ncbi:MAG TPA: tRNA isopentenyl-2-thiomethyl-A-37 hydroxylase MiaE [Polyangiaceae bacterium]|nr:tRNA isopentenyl-2-thiomethyl-A-37 hydroxylase MiaE [Polyangiaceae bacterium]
MFCLKQPTDAAWAAEAVRQIDSVLVDHAHCEMKAASNALSLAARHPGDVAIVRGLTDLAREEIDHFQRVLSMLDARGVAMGPPPVDTYAAELRRVARESRSPAPMAPIVDRLLVGALIEARSCERFKLLADETACDGAHGGEHDLWSDLLAVEARHYRTFVDLATRAAGGARARVMARLERLAELEGVIVNALGRGPVGCSRATIHG